MKKKKRYFLIAYNFINKGNVIQRPGNGEILLVTDSFPSRDSIRRELIIKNRNMAKFVIVSIYEFKTKEDYNSFEDK